MVTAAEKKSVDDLTPDPFAGLTGLDLLVAWTAIGTATEALAFLTCLADRTVLVLDAAAQEEAVRALQTAEGIVGMEARMASSAWLTARNAIRVFGNPQVRACAVEGRRFHPEALFGGSGKRTLYVVGTALEQERLAPLFLALMDVVVTAWVDRAERYYAGRVPPAEELLIVGDEIANVAPLGNLPIIASTGGGMGLRLILALQDGLQLVHRYGPQQAGSILANCHAKIVMGGITDKTTLQDLSAVIGSEWVPTTSTHDGAGSSSVSESMTRTPIADENLLRSLRRGEAAVVYGNRPPIRIKVRSPYL
jgi:type IV secretory pathway TraG/TraD family ATPase VirD4